MLRMSSLPLAALALSITTLSGCLGTDTPAPEKSETAMAASTLGGSWTRINSAWPSHKPAFTAYPQTGWTLWPFDPVGGNYKVRRHNNGTATFVSGALIDIDIEANTILWGLNISGAVLKNSSPYSSNGGTWNVVCSGCGAFEVATGADGSVYILKHLSPPRTVVRKFQPGSNTWIDMAGPEYGVSIDVDNNGDLYVASYTNVWRKPGGNPAAAWDIYSISTAYTLRNIAAGGGKVYVIDNDVDEYGGRVFQLNRATRQFDELPAPRQWDLQVSASGVLWATSRDYSLMRYNP